MNLSPTIVLIFALLICTSCNVGQDNKQINKTASEGSNKINARYKQDSIALNQLVQDAKITLQLDEFSVLDNSPIPPSGDQHDYYSWSSYFWPNPATSNGLPYIHKDGKINPTTDTISDKPLLRRMVAAVQTLSLAYFYTQNKEYALKANSFLSTWFINEDTKMNPNLQFAQCVPGEEHGQPYGVIDTRWFILLVQSIDLLYEEEAISLENYNSLKQWFQEYLEWLHTSETGKKLETFENNIGSWYMAQKATYAAFTDQKEFAQSILNESKKFFTHQIDSIGRVTHELQRTKSFDYSLYSINALLTLLEVAYFINSTNMDSTKMHKEILLKSIQFMASFNDTDNPWPYPQIADQAITLGYEDGLSFSVYYPYDLYYTLKKGYFLLKDESLLSSMSRISNHQTETHRANLLY